jgi:hypothetical protein
MLLAVFQHVIRLFVDLDGRFQSLLIVDFFLFEFWQKFVVHQETPRAWSLRNGTWTHVEGPGEKFKQGLLLLLLLIERSIELICQHFHF